MLQITFRFFTLFLLYSLLTIHLTFATGKGGGGAGTQCPCNCKSQTCYDNCADCRIPLDGGIGILLAAGLAYGTKKVYDKSKRKN